MAIKSFKSRLLVILGPTSTGKTDLALSLAKKFNGGLVSCDSRQVYTNLDIGTGKAPSGKCKVQSEKCKVKKEKGWWEINGIKIWLYDMVNPKKQYTVFDYVKAANKVIDEIFKRGKLPIIVGGTGLYLKALLEGLPNLSIPMDLKLRKKLEKLSLRKLQKKLQELSPQRWGKMNNSDRRNPRRLIRAIEIVILSTSTLLSVNSAKDLPRMWDSNKLRDSSLIAQNDILKIGLTAPREVLYKRIDERVISRIDQGMIDETKELHAKGLSYKRMKQLGLEYGVLADYLEGNIISKDELIKILQGKIHGFARRQQTWFKNPSTLRPRSGRASSGYIYWFDVTEKNYLRKVENFIAKWYDQSR